jgi:signal transduction histidine kinase
VGRVFTLSLTSALNPTLLAAVTVMLTLLKPKRLLTGYLAGAAVTSVVCGLLLVFTLHGSSSSSTAKHSVDPVLNIALGCLLLLVVFVVGTGRDTRRRGRSARKREEAKAKPPGLLVWRFVSGTPPRRRALAIGGAVALLFLLTQATYRTITLLSPQSAVPSTHPVADVIQWTFVGARATIWYGFLFALVAAEVYAGGVLRRLVRNSLAHPSLSELEHMLRDPLGDPSLRLGFWRSSTRDWAAADGTPLQPADPGQVITEVERDGHPAAAIVHDRQLSEDPELLQAAGAVALLALENAELDLAWKESVRELADSWTRIAKASDRERRKLERDLHDGAQQRLLGVLLRLSTASELTTENPDLHSQFTRAERELEEAIGELREPAHGIYPTILADRGLAGALHAISRRFPANVSVTEASHRRFPPEIEAAFYYCCLEAIQNATKHAGPDAHTTIRLHADSHELHLDVSDNGSGFDLASAPSGMGLQNMRDRLDAIGGHTEILSSRGYGTLVRAAAPLNTLAR